MNKSAKRRVLFISSNDGSDMRINKELKTLSQQYEVTFIGVGLSNKESYARNHCKYFYLVSGKRNRPLTILKQFWLVTKLAFNGYDSIHVINEQLMIFFYPFMFGKHVVLDIFDSIFLMKNKSRNKWLLIKKIIYAPVDVILVTDNNRKTLMPDFTQHKISVLENFPYHYTGPIRENSASSSLTLLYNGWLGKNRGTDLVNQLLAVDNKVKIIMAGWFADEQSRELINHPQVDYRGIMTQEQALSIAATEADYILCVYASNNENNINASPNKIYDAIQTHTPVIANAEIKISTFVKENKIGVVIDNYNTFNPIELLAELSAKKNTFSFSPDLIETYTWEKIENILITAHAK